MTGVDDLIAFLNARLDEDERLARRADADKENGWWWGPDAESPIERHVARHDPVRVLAEVDAKRRLLNWVKRTREWAIDNNLWSYDEAEPLKLLALSYADHPDYRPEWRPAE